MKQFLRAELYRMKKSKSPLILLIACAGVSLLNSVTYGFMFGNAGWLTGFYENVLGFNPFAISDELGIEAIGTVKSLGDFTALIVGGNGALFTALFIGIFLVSLRRSGFIRNIASEVSRQQIFVIHAVLIAGFSLLQVLLSAIAPSLVFFLFYRGLPAESFTDMLLYILTAWLLVAATGIMVLLLTDVFRRPTTAIILSMFYLWIGASLLFAFTDGGGTVQNGTAFRLQYVSLVGNLGLLTAGELDTVLSSLLVVVLYVGLAFALEMTVIKKKDLC